MLTTHASLLLAAYNAPSHKITQQSVAYYFIKTFCKSPLHDLYDTTIITLLMSLRHVMVHHLHVSLHAAGSLDHVVLQTIQHA